MSTPPEQSETNESRGVPLEDSVGNERQVLQTGVTQRVEEVVSTVSIDAWPYVIQSSAVMERDHNGTAMGATRSRPGTDYVVDTTFKFPCFTSWSTIGHHDKDSGPCSIGDGLRIRGPIWSNDQDVDGPESTQSKTTIGTDDGANQRTKTPELDTARQPIYQAALRWNVYWAVFTCTFDSRNDCFSSFKLMKTATKRFKGFADESDSGFDMSIRMQQDLAAIGIEHEHDVEITHIREETGHLKDDGYVSVRMRFKTPKGKVVRLVGRKFERREVSDSAPERGIHANADPLPLWETCAMWAKDGLDSPLQEIESDLSLPWERLENDLSSPQGDTE